MVAAVPEDLFPFPTSTEHRHLAAVAPQQDSAEVIHLATSQPTGRLVTIKAIAMDTLNKEDLTLLQAEDSVMETDFTATSAVAESPASTELPAHRLH